MSNEKSSFYQLIFSEGLYKLKSPVSAEEVAALETYGSPFMFLYKESAGEVNEDLVELLKKMVKAVQLDPAKTPLYNLDVEAIDFRVIKAAQTTKVIFAFGAEPKDLQLEMPFRNSKPVDHLGIRIFFLDPLSLIASKPTRKKFLWTLLKDVFSL